VGKQCVEVLSAFVDDSGKTDYFGPRADDNQQFQFAVILEVSHSLYFV